MSTDNAAPPVGQHHLHPSSSGEPGQADADDVRPVNAAPLLAGCTGIARVGICIRCERLYIGGPQIAPLAKRESGVYRCIEFVSNGQRLADKGSNKHVCD